MNLTARDRIRELTGLLTALSLVLIIAAVRGFAPEPPEIGWLVSAIPHLNAVISVFAIGTILSGVRAIKQRNVTTHRRAMLASTALFGAFLVLYLYRISLEGPTVFAGPDVVRQFVYLPVLAIHILLAIVCLPFVYAALLIAGTHDARELSETAHPRLGKVAATLWLISFALGIVVYGLLYLVF